MTLPLGHDFRFIDVLNQDVVMRFIALNVLLITVEDEKNICVVVVVVFSTCFHGFSSQVIGNLLSKTGW